jgi:hypothetical protein
MGRIYTKGEFMRIFSSRMKAEQIIPKIFRQLIFTIIIVICSNNLYADDIYPSTLSYSIDRGFYQQPFDVELTVDTTDALIKYTLDGSDPSSSANAISQNAPVTVHIDPENLTNRYQAPGVCLRAVGFIGDTQITRVKTHSYLFADKVVSLSPDGIRPGPQWPQPNNSGGGQYIDYGMDPDVCEDARYSDLITDALLDIPSFSIATDLKHLFDPNTGIYMNPFGRGIDWERPTSIELIYPGGRDGFQINGGIRIRGGWSRHEDNPKHAFRLFFRGEYGETNLRYPLFGDEGVAKFDKVDLRTSQNYSWAYKGEGDDTGRHNTMLREVFCRDLQREMGVPYTRSRYYHLFLNGVYWGLFQTQERSDASYAETYFGGSYDEYDVIKKNPEAGGLEADDGNMDAWNELWTIASRGFTSDEDYYRIQGLNPDGTSNPEYPILVDLNNLIIYMLGVYYTGDYDSPISAFAGNNYVNNIFAIYNRIHPDGFKFFRHDPEHTMFLEEGGIPGAAIDRTGPYPAGETLNNFNPQWLHQQLTNHPEYILKFTDLVYKYFFNDGILTPDAVIALIQERKAQIEKAIIAESARWGDSKVSTPRTYDKDWLPAVNFLLDEYAPIRTEMVIDQFKVKGWYPDIDPPSIEHPGGVVSKGTEIAITATRGSIYYTLDGSDPHLPYGQSDYNNYLFITKSAEKYALVPQSDIGNTWRSELSYDISGWQTVSGEPGGIGYESGSGFESLISLNLIDQMYDPDGSNPSANTCCYIRIPFTVAGDILDHLTSLELICQYDDGIVVYLNGTKILEENVPADAAWDAIALGAVADESAERTFNLTPHLGSLFAGENLLAIHALNTSRESSDFLVTTYLSATDKTSSSGIGETAQLYSAAVPINQSGKLKARVHQDEGWSAVSEIGLWVNEDVHELRITEIHYHPLDEGEEDNDAEYEFIEIKNISSTEYDLGGYRFSQGIDYVFPEGLVLEGGKIIVLAANKASFEERYGFLPYAEYGGQLDNNGERLVLENANGDTLIQIRYNDKYPWPVSADGEGYSLVVRSELPGVDISDSLNWTRSAKIHGSPGVDESIASIDPVPENRIVRTFQLFQNYPNPFNPVTTIRFQIPKSGRVQLRIYNVLGQEVAKLADDFFPAGVYQTQWYAGNLASGVYIYQIRSQDFIAVKKLILLK